MTTEVTPTDLRVWFGWVPTYRRVVPIGDDPPDRGRQLPAARRLRRLGHPLRPRRRARPQRPGQPGRPPRPGRRHPAPDRQPAPRGPRRGHRAGEPVGYRLKEISVQPGETKTEMSSDSVESRIWGPLERQWPSLRRLRVGSAIAIAVIAINAAVTFANLWKIRDDWKALSSSFEAASALDGLLARLTDAETGQRGFLLTREGSYLEPYHRARSALNDSLARLGTSAEADPATHQRVAEVGAMAISKLAELEETLRLEQARGADAAIALVKSGRGKVLMETLRRQVAVIHAQEDSHRRRLEREMRQAIAWTINLFAATSTVALILLMAVHRLDQRSREQLGRHARWFSTTLQSIGDAVIATDAAGCISFMNRRRGGAHRMERDRGQAEADRGSVPHLERGDGGRCRESGGRGPPSRNRRGARESHGPDLEGGGSASHRRQRRPDPRGRRGHPGRRHGLPRRDRAAGRREAGPRERRAAPRGGPGGAPGGLHVRPRPQVHLDRESQGDDRRRDPRQARRRAPAGRRRARADRHQAAASWTGAGASARRSS